MQTTAQVPHRAGGGRDELLYMEDYRRAYKDCWVIAWLSVCLDHRLNSSEIVGHTEAKAHAIAANFADLHHQFRH